MTFPRPRFLTLRPLTSALLLLGLLSPVGSVAGAGTGTSAKGAAGSGTARVVASASGTRTVSSADGRVRGRVTFTLQIVRDGASAYAATRVTYDVPVAAFGTGFSHLLPAGQAGKAGRPLSMSNPRQTLAFPRTDPRPVVKTAWRSPNLMPDTPVPANVCAAAQLNLHFNGAFPFAPVPDPAVPALDPAVIDLRVCEGQNA